MKVLVIGNGGREHALCWKINKSPLVDKIYCAPGNAGISIVADCIDISVTDFGSLINFVKEKNIQLTVVGPEVPLSLGIVDEFEKEGLKIFGPNKAAAEIEGSKVFSKNLMKKYGIKTAAYETFTDPIKAKEFINKIETPFVVKADGLAAGKGVIICKSKKDGEEALDSIMECKAFGDAGNEVVIEEFLDGEEASFFVFTDGSRVLPLESSQDHKAIYDEDKGPNTGGMGAYSPAPIVNGLHEKIMSEVIMPTILGLSKEGRSYKGILYAGLMIKDKEIKVLEFNCRFGDPEAQPLLMRMESDIVPIMLEIAENKLHHNEIKWKSGYSVCVVLASKGYPGSYEKGVNLKNIEKLKNTDDLMVFHAGTSFKENNIVTNGGRVLGVTAIAQSLEESIDKAYAAVDSLKQENLVFRTDIGKKALK